MGGQSSDQGSQTEVSDAVGNLVVVENTFQDLRDGDVGFPTKTVCRLNDLGATLCNRSPQTGSNPIFSSIHQP